MNKIKILLAAHKKTPILKSDIFSPTHVGRALASDKTKEELCDYIADDSGVNISNKNVQYAEITALFWAWKNLPKDITHVGLMHYGRFFNLSNKKYNHPENIFNEISSNVIDKFSLKDEIVDNLCSKYDLIIPEKWEMRKEHIEYEHHRYNYVCSEIQQNLKSASSVLNMYEHYALGHIKEDIDLAIDVIKRDYPQMEMSLNSSLKATSARFTNMFIMKKEYFDNYCDFLFNILSEVEREKKHTENPAYLKGSFQSRVFGFLSERIFSIYMDFLLKNEEVRFIEKQIVFADYKSEKDMEDDRDCINIVMSCDNNYAPYLAIAISSIFENANKEDVLKIFILNGGINKRNIDKISGLSSKYNQCIKFVDIDIKTFETDCFMSETCKHISLPTYFRYSVSSLLPDSIKKVLYLDVDILVTASLSNLWKTNLDLYLAAAVEDTYEYAVDSIDRLGIGSDKYYNAGIMLINLEAWRLCHIEEKLFAYSRKMGDKLIFVDQDALNAILSPKIYSLDFRYNVQQTFFLKSKKNIDICLINKSISNPFIIHYSGHIKPWDTGFHSWHPLSFEYYTFWKKSSYKFLLYKFYLSKKKFDFLHRIFGWRFEYFHLRKEKLRSMFNERYYLDQYPDVLEANIDPLLHYVKYGWKEGRNPSADFNTNSYLSNNADVKKANLNPFFHYLVYGLQERRKK